MKAWGLRSTRIKTWDNVELIVPNSQFLNSIVTNWSTDDANVRIGIPVGASYKSDPLLVKKALLEAAANSEFLQTPAPSVVFVDFADSSINFELQVWTHEPKKIAPLSSDLRFSIWAAFENHGIEMPFPQRDLHVHYPQQTMADLVSAEIGRCPLRFHIGRLTSINTLTIT